MDAELRHQASGLDGSDQNLENSFLFIGELAKRTGVDPKTIRFYERAELLSPPRHGRFRTYLATDVRRLRNVLALRKLGVPIAQIRDVLATAGDSADILDNNNAVQLLRGHLELLKSKQGEITRQIEQTALALEKFVV